MDESDGLVKINVVVKAGSLQREVVVSFSTSNLTATGRIQLASDNELNSMTPDFFFQLVSTMKG